MNINKKEFLSRPFILTPADLEKFCEYLKTFNNTITIVVVCADGIKREFESLDEFLQFENPPKKDIQEVGLNVLSTDFKTKILISFSKRSSLTILVKFEGGEEEAALKLDQFLSERLSAMKPWYSFFVEGDFKRMLISVFLQTMVVLMVVIPLTKSLNAQHVTMTWQITITVVISIILNMLLTRLRKAFFPTGVFLIGQGVKRHEDKDRIRTLIIVGFVVNLLAGIAILLMSQ